MNKLNKFIKTGKDRLSKEDHCNVVYKINYLDCESSWYIEQIKRKLKRKLKTQIKEYRADKKFPEAMSDVIPLIWPWTQIELG